MVVVAAAGIDIALHARPEALVVDLSAAAFVDSTRLGELGRAARTAAQIGIRAAWPPTPTR